MSFSCKIEKEGRISTNFKNFIFSGVEWVNNISVYDWILTFITYVNIKILEPAFSPFLFTFFSFIYNSCLIRRLDKGKERREKAGGRKVVVGGVRMLRKKRDFDLLFSFYLLKRHENLWMEKRLPLLSRQWNDDGRKDWMSGWGEMGKASIFDKIYVSSPFFLFLLEMFVNKSDTHKKERFELNTNEN